MIVQASDKDIRSISYLSRLLIIDGSPLIYIHGHRPDYKDSIDDHMKSLMANTHSSLYTGFLDSSGNFRKDISNVYKSNRARDKNELLERYPFYFRVIDYLVTEYKFLVLDNIESDDAVAYINNLYNTKSSYELLLPNITITSNAYKTVVCSIDKDLMQLDCDYYNLKTHEFIKHRPTYLELHGTTSKKLKGSGYMWLYAQMLMGDSVDMVKGINKCGPVKAYNTLYNCKTEQDCIDAVKKAYEDEYGDDYMTHYNVTYNMVYMLQTKEEISRYTSLLNEPSKLIYKYSDVHENQDL